MTSFLQDQVLLEAQHPFPCFACPFVSILLGNIDETLGKVFLIKIFYTRLMPALKTICNPVGSNTYFQITFR